MNEDNNNTHQLSFCSITLIESDIAEVIPHSGIEVSLEMLKEFWDFVGQKMDENIDLLINKKAPYSYQFSALITLSETKRIRRIAVVTYDQASINMSSYMKNSFNKSGKEIEIFESREAAVEWLYNARK